MKQFKVNSKNAVYNVFADSEVEAVNKVKEVEAKVGDSHDTELKLLKPLESVVQKWRAWRNKHQSLFDLEKKYWRDWDGYRSTLAKDNPQKLKLLEQQMLKANQEVQPVIDEWNRIAEGVMRKGWIREWEEGKIYKLEPETFPSDHLFRWNLDNELDEIKRRIAFQKRHDSIMQDYSITKDFEYVMANDVAHSFDVKKIVKKSPLKYEVTMYNGVTVKLKFIPMWGNWTYEINGTVYAHDGDEWLVRDLRTESFKGEEK